MLKKIPILIALFSNLSVSAKIDNDFQQWSLVTLNQKLNDKWGLYYEIQNRIGDNFSHEGLLFLRPAINYRLDEHSLLWQGYAWVPNFSNSNMINEHRLWQQIDYQTKYKSIDLFSWMRLEERFLEGVDTMSLRDRFRVGFRLPLFNFENWKFMAFNELFINFYNLADGPAAGFDQDWTFAGLERKINDNASINFGYLLNYLNRDTDILAHSIRVHLNVNF